jgi:GT2 family glycosyltransferase
MTDGREGHGGPRVAVVIVSFNVRDLLRDCLQSVLAPEGVSLELVVVDNASSDGSVEMVLQEFPSVCLIKNDRNRGFSAASNQGIKATRGAYVLSLNPDTVLHAGALASLAGYLDGHPAVGAVGPKIVRPDGSLDLAARRSFPSPAVAFFRLTLLSRLFPHNPRFARYNLTDRSPDEEQEIDSGTAACLMLRREALDQVGNFDEDYFMYGEDLDLCFRLKAAGWRIMYLPTAVVLHIKGQSSQQRSNAMLRAFHRSMWIFFKKHYRQRTPAAAVVMIRLGIELRSLGLQLTNALRRQKRVSR